MQNRQHSSMTIFGLFWLFLAIFGYFLSENIPIFEILTQFFGKHIAPIFLYTTFCQSDSFFHYLSQNMMTYVNSN